MAKGRVEAKLAMTMAMIEVSGMARIAPAAPQIEDQSASATSTTKGDMLIRRPTMRGSSALPTHICAAVSSTAITNVLWTEPNCAMLSTTGKTTPRSEPT